MVKILRKNPRKEAKKRDQGLRVQVQVVAEVQVKKRKVKKVRKRKKVEAIQIVIPATMIGERKKKKVVTMKAHVSPNYAVIF